MSVDLWASSRHVPPSEDNHAEEPISTPRFDPDDRGTLRGDPALDKPIGPKQRRFEFDAKVIRDSVVRKLRSIDRDDIAAPLDACHRDAVYKVCVGCRHTRTFYNRCERFSCPICAARLARDRRHSVKWWQDYVGQPKHVVLTVASVETLTNEYVRGLKDDWRRLRAQGWVKDGGFTWRATAIKPAPLNDEPMPGRHRRRRRLSPWTGEKIGTNSTKWFGGFWSLDVTHGQAGWHVHFHAIVDARFIDIRRLEEEWAKLRGQDMAVVRVYDVRGQDYTAEVCKYACDGIQIGNWEPHLIAQFIDALSGERLFDTFGALYKQRKEYREARETALADNDVCQCGGRHFRIQSESEYLFEQCKSGAAPPERQSERRTFHHPELFAAPSAMGR